MSVSRASSVFEEIIQCLMDDQRAWTREKATERLRAKLAPQQKTLGSIHQAVQKAKRNGSARVIIKDHGEDHEKDEGETRGDG